MDSRWRQRMVQLICRVVSGMGLAPLLRFREPPPAVNPARFAHLPEELIASILVLAAAPSLAPNDIPCFASTFLLLSKRYYHLLLPKLYHTVSIHTASAFRRFRLTIALYNPALGKLVHRLQIGSCEFDSIGYLPTQLAGLSPLSVGIEQMLLAAPNLEELSLDLFALASLNIGTASKLESGCQPWRLTTELTVILHLRLPTFQGLRELELLIFGFHPKTALDLRTTLPRLERLTLRLVTKSNQHTTSRANLDVGSSRPNLDVGRLHQYTLLPPPPPDHVDDGESLTGQDLENLLDALQILRTWPTEVDPGFKLQSVTVLTWPGAVNTLTERIPDVIRIPDSVISPPLSNRDRFDLGDTQSKLYVGVDRSYLLGSRCGMHVLWRKERAHLGWLYRVEPHLRSCTWLASSVCVTCLTIRFCFIDLILITGMWRF